MIAPSDSRDDVTWVVVELTRAGEQQVEQGQLEQVLRNEMDLPAEHPIFVPSTIYRRHGRTITTHLMEGYCFIASGLPEASFFDLERRSPFVKKVLTSRGSGGFPTLAVLPNREIMEMRRRLREAVVSDLLEGSKVLVTQGAFTNMEGMVVDLSGDEAAILFTMRSFKIIRSIPKIFLEPVEDDAV